MLGKEVKARYNLNSKDCPATFDFYYWAVSARSRGATEIVIDDHEVRITKYPEDVVRKRIETIIIAGMSLIGLPWRIGTEGDLVGTHWSQFLDPDFKRLISPLRPKKVRYTVTLRNIAHSGYRNSDIPLWREFAAHIGAHVIEDAEEHPTPLLERVALYAGAEMNFGVVNGPISLLFLTPYPVTMFDCGANPAGWRAHEVAKGSQWHWALPQQRLVWAKPTMDRMLASWDF